MDYGAIATAGAGGVVTLSGQAVLAWIKGKVATAKHVSSLEVDVEKHRDALTFDLLNAAREEVAAARHEAVELRHLQSRLHHFDEALEHIHALLEARLAGLDGDLAERQARAFLVKIKRYAESHAHEAKHS